MILFACDLDNTLIYSAKRLLPEEEYICVDTYEGAEISFMSEKTARLLQNLPAEILLVPLTARSAAQYKRIKWPKGFSPPLALTTGGMILLENGEESAAWTTKSRQLTAPYREELTRMYRLAAEEAAFSACRLTDDMYLFLRAEDADTAAEFAARYAKTTRLTVCRTGRKIYITAPNAHKGAALSRLQQKLKPQYTFCAGDSAADFPMAKFACRAFFPSYARQEENFPPNAEICAEKGVFAEDFLARINIFIKKL